MKRSIKCAALAILAILVSMPAFAQTGPPKARASVPLVVHKLLTLDGGTTGRNAARVTYANSQIDTAWIDLYSADGMSAIDSIHYSVETTDTTRYRVFLLFRNTTSSSAGIANYRQSSGLGLDTLDSQSTTPQINDGRISPVLADGQWKPGIQQIGIGIKFSSSGNHVGVTRKSTYKYGVWATIFYRAKQVILQDSNLTDPNRGG